jgi:hypothetical protein
MKQLTIRIADEKLSFFKELLKNFNFIQLTEVKDLDLSVEQQEYVEGIKSSLNQVDQHIEGKIRLQSAKSFLDEL